MASESMPAHFRLSYPPLQSAFAGADLRGCRPRDYL